MTSWIVGMECLCGTQKDNAGLLSLLFVLVEGVEEVSSLLNRGVLGPRPILLQTGHPVHESLQAGPIGFYYNAVYVVGHNNRPIVLGAVGIPFLVRQYHFGP